MFRFRLRMESLLYVRPSSKPFSDALTPSCVFFMMRGLHVDYAWLHDYRVMLATIMSPGAFASHSSNCT